MTSAYLTDVRVYIAFDSGYRTPAADRTWTEVTDYVEAEQGISITRGRADESSEVSASTLSLVLDNKDGRFTPARAASPYYPNVKVGRPIKVTSTHDSVEYVRFVGYVDEWPVVWDGTDATAYAPITASSRLARLGTGAALLSVVDQTIVTQDVWGFWPLSEASDSVSASDLSGFNRPPLRPGGSGTTAVTFGNATGPTTDGATAATFTATGKDLRTANVNRATSDPFGGVGLFVSCSGSVTRTFITAQGSVQIGTSSGNVEFRVFGDIGSPAEVTVAETTINDSGVHHLALTMDGATNTMTAYVDGESVGTDTWGGDLDGSADAPIIVGNGAFSASKVTVWDTEPDGSAIADIWESGTGGFAGESPASRLARYAAYDGITSAERSFDAGFAPIAHIDTTGTTTLAAMQSVATTDGGVLFDAGDGTLTYLDRFDRYAKTSAFTLDLELGEAGGITPTFDRQALINDATVSNLTGTLSSRASDADSIADYGLAQASVQVATEQTDETLNRAAWLVGKYAQPSPRITSLTVEVPGLIGNAGADPADVLSADIGTRFTLDNLPTQAHAASQDFFIEGYTETITHDSHTLALNVSPYELSAGVFVFASSAFKTSGTDPFAY